MSSDMPELDDFHRMVADTRVRPNGSRLRRMLRELPYLERRSLRRLLAWGTAALIAAALLLLMGRPAAAAVPPTPYEAGLQAAAEHRYAQALALFQQAAQQGDRAAMRNLGLMLLYGQSLYAQEVPRNQEQARRWLRAAASAGCEVSAFMLKQS